MPGFVKVAKKPMKVPLISVGTAKAIDLITMFCEAYVVKNNINS